jgi:PBP1b-binding outer membrane lipoprotein LpoB
MKKLMSLVLLILALFVISCSGTNARTSKYGPKPQEKRMPMLPQVEEVTAYTE